MTLLINEKSGQLKAELQLLDHLLRHCLKKKMDPKKLGQKFKFDSIHCDIWNRYAQKVSGIVV